MSVACPQVSPSVIIRGQLTHCVSVCVCERERDLCLCVGGHTHTHPLKCVLIFTSSDWKSITVPLDASVRIMVRFSSTRWETGTYCDTTTLYKIKVYTDNNKGPSKTEKTCRASLKFLSFRQHCWTLYWLQELTEVTLTISWLVFQNKIHTNLDVKGWNCLRNVLLFFNWKSQNVSEGKVRLTYQ